jgi:glutamine---fructose-6-phosphate transaminase (isomerizing)
MQFIEQEIQEQPSAIRRVLQQADHFLQIVRHIRDFNPNFVMIAARGSSDNAARYAKYVLGLHHRLPVVLATPSLSTLYGVSLNVSKALVIGISQSGKSEDLLAVIDDANAEGALTLSFTNDETSPLAQNTQYHIPLLAGPEKSVAATKTYTTELAALAALTAYLKDDAALQVELEQLPAWVEETLQHTASIPEWIERYRYMQRFAVISRGVNYATAYEISLKIKELCYLSGEEYSEADFLHGPIAMLEPGFPIIAVMVSGQTQGNMQALLNTLHDRRAECMLISNVEVEAHLWQNLMPISQMPEWLTPITAVLPGQQFARYLASVRGHDVDTPRGLNKVTVTR